MTNDPTAVLKRVEEIELKLKEGTTTPLHEVSWLCANLRTALADTRRLEWKMTPGNYCVETMRGWDAWTDGTRAIGHSSTFRTAIDVALAATPPTETEIAVLNHHGQIIARFPDQASVPNQVTDDYGDVFQVQPHMIRVLKAATPREESS